MISPRHEYNQRRMRKKCQIRIVCALILVLWTCVYGQSDPSAKCQRLNDKKKNQTDDLFKLINENFDNRTKAGNYNKMDRPIDKRLNLTKVSISVVLHSVHAINNEKNHFAASLFLKQSWVDLRLQHDYLNKTIKYIKLHPSYLEKIWIPDTVFENEVRSDKSEFSQVLLMVYNNGTIFLSQNIDITLYCNTDYTSYPLDSQYCGIDISSFSYQSNELIYEPMAKVMLSKSSSLRSSQVSFKDCGHRSDPLKRGGESYSQIKGRCQFSRRIPFFIMQIYFPTALVVLISWANMNVNRRFTPARVALHAITVLTISSQSTGVLKSIEQISYIKAIDSWLIACNIFCMIPVFAYGVVHNLHVKEELRRSSGFSHRASMPIHVKLNVNADHVERASRIIHLFAFICFIIIYAISYSNYEFKRQVKEKQSWDK